MPANKNALIRYKTIDRCLSNHYRQWTLEDLVDACCEALYEMEGISKGVSVRTVQGDIQMMRSDKLGYNAPIEVYDHKYYRYSDPDFTITGMPLSRNDVQVLQEAVDMLRQLEDFEQFNEMTDVINRLQEKLSLTRNERKPIVNFDSVPSLKGIKHLSPLYNYIANRQPIRVNYQSFNAKQPSIVIVHPYLLKEFRNRWFLFCSRDQDMHLLNMALDRIISIEKVQTVSFCENHRFNPEHFFDDVIGVTKQFNQIPQKITFWASREQSQYIKTKPLHPSQQLISENDADGSCVFSINVVHNKELYSVLMSYGPGIKVLSPQKVVYYIRKLLRLTTAHYEAES